MNLVIDQGNTAVKVAIFDGKKRVYHDVFSEDKFRSSFLQVVDNDKITRCIVASVVAGAETRFSFLTEKIANVLYLSARTPLPFIVKYATPDTLGVDRLALVAGAVTRFPNRNVLVISAGTCITFDFINEKGEYLGGAIAPGIQMRLRAMHEFTSKLPLIAEQDFDINNFIGDTTENCMLSGVYNNVICELEGVITQYERQFKNLTIILTGGNHLFLAKYIKNRIFASPFLLLEGLNAILETHRD